MIKDELIELFLEMREHLINLDDGHNVSDDLLVRAQSMRDRIVQGEMYQLGETKTEMSPQVARDYLGLSRPWDIILLCKNNELEYRTVERSNGHLTYWISKDSLEAYAEKRREDAYKAIERLWELERGTR